MIIKFFDTSALLGGYELTYDDGTYINFISPIVFQELEHIKISQNKDENIKYKARALVRQLMDERQNNPSNPLWSAVWAPRNKVRKILNKNSNLEDSNDSLLICEALFLADYYKTNLGLAEDSNPLMFQFITADACQYLIANAYPQLHATYWKETSHKENLWKGYQTFNLNDKELAHYYENPEENTLNLDNNEYAILYHNNELIDLVKWNGEIN